MGPRTRESLQGRYYSGTETYYFLGSYAFGGGVGNSNDYARRSGCFDVTSGPPPYVTPNPLSIVHTWQDGLIINGSAQEPGSPWRMDFTGRRPLEWNAFQYVPNFTAPGSPDYWVTRALANMNPNTPFLDLPVAIIELKDVPGLIRQALRIARGGGRGSDAAGGYVTYSFGVAPILDDLRKLLNLQKAFADRAAYLQRLEGGSVVKRQLGRDRTEQTVSDAYVINYFTSANHALKFDAHIVKEWRVWYTANIQLLASFPSNDERHIAAFRAALGLNPALSQAWELLPWSWLSDYFFNIGTVLQAHRGGIPFKVNHICLMIESKRTEKLVNASNPGGLSFTPARRYYAGKSRSVWHNPTPKLAMHPFLTGHMMGILGSIGASRFLRSVGR